MGFGHRLRPGLRRIDVDENTERVVQSIDHRNQVRERVGGAAVPKHRGAFPSDEALIKLLYLALRNISKRWTLPIRD